jgi:hypothetical protein
VFVAENYIGEKRKKKRAMVVIRFNWSRRSISWDAVSPPPDSFVGYSCNFDSLEALNLFSRYLTLDYDRGVIRSPFAASPLDIFVGYVM